MGGGGSCEDQSHIHEGSVALNRSFRSRKSNKVDRGVHANEQSNGCCIDHVFFIIRQFIIEEITC